MRRGFGVGVILLLALGVFPSKALSQQAGSGPGDGRPSRSRLGQNYPNPFNPETRIPFTLYDEDIVNGRALVTIRIYNLLQQLVAIPDASNHPAGKVPVDGLAYTSPGSYEAYWDGYDKDHRKVASGIYYMQMLVNGRPVQVRKILVGK